MEKKQLVNEAYISPLLINDIRQDIDFHAVVVSKPIGFIKFHMFSISCHVVQPCSACVERALSHLHNICLYWPDRQEQTLEDAVELSEMSALNESIS